MNLEEYRTLFIVATLGLTLIIAAHALSVIAPIQSSSEEVSEIWLLAPTHVAEDYPFNVGVDEESNVFVGVGNHMCCSKYYKICVKFRNPTQSLPNASASEPSILLALYEFRFLVADGETWESPLVFKVLSASVEGDTMFVSSISINHLVFSVDNFSKWDSKNKGFYYQLFCELWLYDMKSQSFQYNNRFVGIWLNVTNPSGM